VPSRILQAVRSRRERPGSDGAGWVRVRVHTSSAARRARRRPAGPVQRHAGLLRQVVPQRRPRHVLPGLPAQLCAPGLLECRHVPHHGAGAPHIHFPAAPTLTLPCINPFSYPYIWNVVMFLTMEQARPAHITRRPLPTPATGTSSFPHHGGTPRVHSPPHLAYRCTLAHSVPKLLGTRQHTVPALSAVCCVSPLVHARECVTCVGTCTQAKRYIREWS